MLIQILVKNYTNNRFGSEHIIDVYLYICPTQGYYEWTSINGPWKYYRTFFLQSKKIE